MGLGTQGSVFRARTFGRSCRCCGLGYGSELGPHSAIDRSIGRYRDSNVIDIIACRYYQWVGAQPKIVLELWFGYRLVSKNRSLGVQVGGVGFQGLGSWMCKIRGQGLSHEDCMGSCSCTASTLDWVLLSRFRG